MNFDKVNDIEVGDSLSEKDILKKKILELCREKYMSLGEISQALGKNKNTIRAGYLYPMVIAGQLKRMHPSGTKAAQKYICE